MKQKLSIFLMTLLAVFFIVAPVSAQNHSTIDAYNTTGQYLVKQVPNPKFGDEWFVIALSRGEYKVPKDYYETYYENVLKHVQLVKGELHNRKYTEYSRLIIALTAIGKDPTNVGGYNLVEKLGDFEKVVWQGPNGAFFGLIALDTWNFTLSKNATTTREKLVDHILSKQLRDGGWDLSGTKADPDMTAMAIQALSNYSEQPRVKNAINRALETLHDMQDANGGYKSWGTLNSESVAQVVTALASINIDPNKDVRFNKTLRNLLSFHNEKDGGFKHALSESASNGMATEQASYTLAAYNRLVDGKTKLYDMSDTKNKPKPEKPVIQPPKLNFKDVHPSHWAKNDIDAAVANGLIRGFSDNTFKPNNQLTRSQTATISVRALKSNAYKEHLFLTLPTKYKASAPSTPITREELAIMLHHAYTIKNGHAYTPSTLAPFKDIGKLSSESKKAITFLYDFEIAHGSGGGYQPDSYLTRAQAAKMFTNFLKVVDN